MTELSNTGPRRNKPGAGRPKKSEDEHKLRLQVYLTPDLMKFVQQRAGSGRGAESRFVEDLVRAAEIQSRMI